MISKEELNKITQNANAIIAKLVDEKVLKFHWDYDGDVAMELYDDNVDLVKAVLLVKAIDVPHDIKVNETKAIITIKLINVHPNINKGKLVIV